MKPNNTYTDEQLSAILSAHAAGMLIIGGRDNFKYNFCCINQAAFNDPSRHNAYAGHGRPARFIAGCFDDQYKEHMTPEELIRMIEAAEELEKRIGKLRCENSFFAY